MIIINFDGWNVGLKTDLAATWLEFDNFEQALEVYDHWNKWLNGENV